MASFDPNDLCEDLVCCVICFEPFDDSHIPKALPCLHTFCSTCLLGHISSNQQKTGENNSKSSGTEFPCPVCKEITLVPENGLAGFKTDFRITRISEVLSRQRNHRDDGASPSPTPQKLSDESGSAYCEICTFFKKKSSGKKYCLECNKHLCKSCADKHLNTPVAKLHSIVSSSDALSNSSTCSIHATEILMYFCKDCAQSICSTCTFMDDHNNHQVVQIDEEAQSAKERLTDLISICNKNIPEIKSKMKEFDRTEIFLASREKLAYKAILLRTAEHMSRIRNEQCKMEQELGKLCKSKIEDLAKDRMIIKDHLDQMTDFCDMAKKVLESGQDSQIVSSGREMSSRLENMAALKLPPVPEQGAFSDLGKFDTMIEENEKETISTDAEEYADAILAEIKCVASQMKMFSIGHGNQPVQCLKVVGKEGESDGCFKFPSGVAIFKNGDFAIADMHNARVQIFDKDGNFKSKFGHTGFKPCGITITKDGNIALTDTKENVNCIKIYNPSGEKIAVIGKGQFEYPFSIAIDSHGNFIISDPAKNEIIILDKAGVVKKRFPTNTKFGFYIAINGKDQILMSDWYHHCIRLFDQNGQLHQRIGNKGSGDGQVMIPLGICTDGRGNMLVLDCKCQRIAIFGSDGVFVKNILQSKTEGIEFSRAIALSREGRLIITHGDNKKNVPNEVRIYQM